MRAGVITALEVQKKNKERVNVYLDDEFAFALSLMEAAKLHKGQALTEAEIALLRDEDTIIKATDRAINFLSYRPRSTQEVRQNLAKNGVEEAVIETVLERLSKMGYLNDRDFARFWIENRNMFKPRGPQALRYELRQKGVSNSIIDESIDSLVDEDSTVYTVARQRTPRLRGSTPQVFRKKLGNFLQRRGFSYSAISDAIRQITGELEADDPDFFTEADEAD